MTVLPQQVERCPSYVFQLAAGDVLFVDSLHVLMTGGDVAFEYLEVLPRLAPGVLVHIHDIFLPYSYPSQWLLERRFWTEQYVLQAFLTFNSAFEVLSYALAFSGLQKTVPLELSVIETGGV